jgi:hypothetical protein
MPTLPEASVSVDAEAGTPATGTDLIVIIDAVSQNADITPRVFSGAKALLDFHKYSRGVDYAAIHADETRKPVMFVGLPIATPGVVSQLDDSGVEGTSVVSVTAAAGGILEETDCSVTVFRGGTIGTDQILLDLSCDDRVVKRVRLGTATSYTIPYLGIVISFAAGTLEDEDVFTFRTSAPRFSQASLALARAALAAQQKGGRSWLIIPELETEDDAADVLAEVNGYETANQRFVYARAQARDRRPPPRKSSLGTVTFDEVGATGDTITRSAGSWIDDGFREGDLIDVAGAVNVANNITGAPIASLTATVITLDATDLVAEAATAGVSVTADGESMAAWVSDIDAEFADIDAERRIDIAGGRARKLSAITGWKFRRPIAWAASIREYQHDVQIPNWRKSDGPLKGWDLEDEDGVTVEYDERGQGGLLAARFTCARTYANGPLGTFIALSLTRDTEGTLLSRTHNLAVANVLCTTVQYTTENAIGRVLELKPDGSATEESLVALEEEVNSAIAIELLQRKKEGRRASAAYWTASRTDILNVAGAELTGQANLLANGTLEKITTRVRVQSAG